MEPAASKAAGPETAGRAAGDRIECIVSKRQHAVHGVEYKVHWEGSTSAEDEWFGDADLKQAYPQLVVDFEQKLDNGPLPLPRLCCGQQASLPTIPKTKETEKVRSGNSRMAMLAASRIAPTPLAPPPLLPVALAAGKQRREGAARDSALRELRSTVEKLEDERHQLRRKLFDAAEAGCLGAGYLGYQRNVKCSRSTWRLWKWN